MTDLLPLLQEFHREKLAMMLRHQAGARQVGQYDANNTYQYVINREETHLSWVQSALAEYGATLPAAGKSALAAPIAPKVTKKVEVGAFKSILEDDARYLGAFVERWRPRVEHMDHARHRTMLNVILGESMEHKRLFDQAASGFEDLLGRRMGGNSRVGGVLSSRWLE